MRRIIAFALLVFCCSLGCLGLDEALRREGVRLSALESEIIALERECDGLALEIASATTPQALALRAEELGMVLAEPENRAWLVAEESETAPLEEEPKGDIFDVFGDLLRRGI